MKSPFYLLLALFLLLGCLFLANFRIPNNKLTTGLKTLKSSSSPKTSRVIESTCSQSATSRGKGQLVVSYSLFGKINSFYYNFLETTVKEAGNRYPGWIVRLYTDIPLKTFYPLMNRYNYLDVCDVTNLPSGIGNASDRFGMLWRFLVLGDPLVNRFLSRDIDSTILPREVDAVSEWISLGTMWHVMRDHPYHCKPMLGGMWGVVNHKNGSLTEELRSSLLKEEIKKVRGNDQMLLTKLVWPHVKKDVTSHDSFCCQSFPVGFRAFPTVRSNKDFVGAVRGMQLKKKCPLKCRPASHPHWKQC